MLYCILLQRISYDETFSSSYLQCPLLCSINFWFSLTKVSAKVIKSCAIYLIQEFSYKVRTCLPVFMFVSITVIGLQYDLNVGDPVCTPKIRICVNTAVCRRKWSIGSQKWDLVGFYWLFDFAMHWSFVCPLVKFKCFTSLHLQTLALHCASWNNITNDQHVHNTFLKHKYSTHQLCCWSVFIDHNTDITIEMLQSAWHTYYSTEQLVFCALFQIFQVYGLER